MVDKTDQGGTSRVKRKSKNLPAIGFGSAIYNLKSLPAGRQAKSEFFDSELGYFSI